MCEEVTDQMVDDEIKLFAQNSISNQFIDVNRNELSSISICCE